MSPGSLLFFGVGLPILIAAAALRFLWPDGRAAMACRIAVVTLVPLFLLSSYLVLEYGTWHWRLAPHGSFVPHAIAAALFVVGLVFLMVRATVSTGAKLLVGVVVGAGWIPLWFLTALFTACAMGDCL